MDFITNFFLDWGLWGMLVAAFLAGSFVPFSSEAVMVALFATGIDPWQLVIYGTVGNVLGSVFNYTVGRMGRLDWMEKYLHVSREKLLKTQRLMGGHGAWVGFFSFIPVLGSAITIAMGYMRSNILISFTAIIFGKVLRYALLVWVWQAV